MSDLLRRTLGETIAIETVLAAAPWRVSADANQLESALLNLAVNARDAMPDGGKLTIRTANATLDQADVAGQEEVRPGPYVMIAVTDTGTGMSKDVLQKAFDPFFTTKEIGQGTGQGLAIAHAVVVDKHGGKIDVASQVGQGTTFTITLPVRGDTRVRTPRATGQPIPKMDDSPDRGHEPLTGLDRESA
jgi:signal transduction histidine kinase